MIRSLGFFTMLWAGGAKAAVSCYTDYLGLLRIAGRWWIVSKLYVAEHR